MHEPPPSARPATAAKAKAKAKDSPARPSSFAARLPRFLRRLLELRNQRIAAQQQQKQQQQQQQQQLLRPPPPWRVFDTRRFAAEPPLPAAPCAASRAAPDAGRRIPAAAKTAADAFLAVPRPLPPLSPTDDDAVDPMPASLTPTRCDSPLPTAVSPQQQQQQQQQGEQRRQQRIALRMLLLEAMRHAWLVTLRHAQTFPPPLPPQTDAAPPSHYGDDDTAEAGLFPPRSDSDSESESDVTSEDERVDRRCHKRGGSGSPAVQTAEEVAMLRFQFEYEWLALLQDVDEFLDFAEEQQLQQLQQPQPLSNASFSSASSVASAAVPATPAQQALALVHVMELFQRLSPLQAAVALAHGARAESRRQCAQRREQRQREQQLSQQQQQQQQQLQLSLQQRPHARALQRNRGVSFRDVPEAPPVGSVITSCRSRDWSLAESSVTATSGAEFTPTAAAAAVVIVVGSVGSSRNFGLTDSDRQSSQLLHQQSSASDYDGTSSRKQQPPLRPRKLHGGPRTASQLRNAINNGEDDDKSDDGSFVLVRRSDFEPPLRAVLHPLPLVVGVEPTASMMAGAPRHLPLDWHRAQLPELRAAVATRRRLTKLLVAARSASLL